MTPDQVHYGQTDAVHEARQKILDLADAADPERFVKKSPNPPTKPTAVWINPPVQNMQTGNKSELKLQLRLSDRR